MRRLFLQLLLLTLASFVHGEDGDSVQAQYHWAPATAPYATVQQLHNEYYNIFKYGNRNAASHRWATFVLDRAFLMSQDRLSLFFTGFCAVSGSPVRPSDHNRYRLTLPKLGGGLTTGYLHYCCWPCVCDTQDFIRVDTKTITLENGMERQFQFAVIGNPCDDPDQLSAKWKDPFGRHEMTSLAETAAEVRCTSDGKLEGATLSDHGYIIIGMFFDSQEALADGQFGIVAGATDDLVDPTPGRMSMAVSAERTGYRGYQDEREYKSQCEERALNGYNSGMGEIFRKVCAVSPIPDAALGKSSGEILEFKL